MNPQILDMIIYKEFETERLLITPTIEQDAILIYEMMNSPNFIN